MRTLLSSLTALVALVLLDSSATAVTMDWTFVGNPGNACDPQSNGCFGAIPNSYYIGTYDVTNAQYAEFLNAVAATDTNGLYDTHMANPAPIYSTGYGGITRGGSSGSYTYSTIAGRENMPVNWVSVYDAMRFANWLNKDQPTGAQNSTTTEDGAYTFSGATTVSARNPSAIVVLPNENEWYKAAYYDPQTAIYNPYPFADGFNGAACDRPSGTTTHSANCANAVGDLTPVGSYAGSPSAYGTFDQGGNVEQWNEESLISGEHGRAGNAGYPPGLLSAASQDHITDPAGEGMGFRLAMIPEPSTGLLVVAGLLGLGGLRRCRA